MEVTDEMLKTMEVGLAFRDYIGRISSMDFHSKATNYLVTASDDESIRLYDIQNAVCLKTINSKKYGVELVCFTTNPTLVLYSSKNGWDESLRLLSLNDNRFVRYFKGHLDRVVAMSLCYEKDSFLSGSLDRTVLLWDLRADKAQGLLRVQGRPAVSYDDQGLVFAVAYGGYVRMFDARKFEKGPFDIFSVGNDESEANMIKFSSDGRRLLLTTKAGCIHVLDSFHGNSLATFNVKPVVTNSTLEASFSPDGNHIISGSGDGSVYAWSVRSGKKNYPAGSRTYRSWDRLPLPSKLIVLACEETSDLRSPSAVPWTCAAYCRFQRTSSMEGRVEDSTDRHLIVMETTIDIDRPQPTQIFIRVEIKMISLPNITKKSKPTLQSLSG
ncbi:unnamed protein product [Triticum turgidum subsp. durum]|uniref:Uncharacterized protein n=1 Tax=Triticum turgidum subsp. durum TaxID=4567 RepID=A0A9R0W0L1_TRITD|nr:unnamed protein product [Triticum turgidum subsp. durum]